MQILPNENDFQPFNFNGFELRGKLVNNEPVFIGADACKALDLKNPWDALGRLDEDDLGITEVIDSLGRTQKMKTVNESGLYQLIFQSRTNGAKAFKKWVTSEVLPQIRKTGSYERPKTLEERSLELIQDLTAELEAARPKVQVFDKVLTHDHTFGFRELCKNLREHFPINETDVKRVMRDKGLLYQRGLVATSKAVDQGWAVQRASGIWGGKERFQPRFTTKTLEWLLDELAPLEDVA